MQEVTIGRILKGNTYGVLKNAEGLFITVSTYYQNGTQRILIVFAKPNEVARDFAVNTTSQKKAIGIIQEGGYQLVNN